MLKVEDPALLREEIRRLKTIVETQEEQLIQLRQALRPPEWEPPIELGLTVQEARLVAALYKVQGEVLSKERLHYALYHDKVDQPDIKIVDVFVCKFRKKLVEYGISVETAWGRGYYLDAKSISIIREWGVDPHEQLAA